MGSAKEGLGGRTLRSHGKHEALEILDRPTFAAARRYIGGMPSTAEINKAVVQRFNEEFLARGDEAVLAELMHPDFVNRTAIPGVDPGIDGMRHVVKEVLHRALSDIRVEIDDQLADGDRVATRKRILGRHTGDLLGAGPTGRDVQIVVLDIVRLRDGRYVEHWGLNTIALVAQQLKAAVL